MLVPQQRATTSPAGEAHVTRRLVRNMCPVASEPIFSCTSVTSARSCNVSPTRSGANHSQRVPPSIVFGYGR